MRFSDSKRICADEHRARRATQAQYWQLRSALFTASLSLVWIAAVRADQVAGPQSWLVSADPELEVLRTVVAADSVQMVDSLPLAERSS